ncbi:MAG: response regulator, partial [Chitinophagaceae bacterium]
MKKILLIEDNQEILENIAEILDLAGYDVYTASEGKMGVAKAIECHPDLIISDIMMPALDGYGVLHLIQKNPELAGTPFIFLTAKTDRSDFRKGMEMGADDYITKPFTDTELLNAIETRLKKAERSKANDNDKIESDRQEHTLKELFEHSVVDKYKRKQVIFSEDNHPQYLFYVVKGKVKAFKTSEYGKELTVGLYAAGDFIGYTALLEESTYKVTAEALEETEIAIISRKDFFELIDSNSAVAMQFIRIIADKNN